MINVSGHRLSTAEIESALIMHNGVAETAGQYLTLSLQESDADALLCVFNQ